MECTIRQLNAADILTLFAIAIASWEVGKSFSKHFVFPRKRK